MPARWESPVAGFMRGSRALGRRRGLPSQCKALQVDNRELLIGDCVSLTCFALYKQVCFVVMVWKSVLHSARSEKQCMPFGRATHQHRSGNDVGCVAFDCFLPPVSASGIPQVLLPLRTHFSYPTAPRSYPSATRTTCVSPVHASAAAPTQQKCARPWSNVCTKVFDESGTSCELWGKGLGSGRR